MPRWLKIGDTLFAACVVPVYLRQYGWRNFLWFSDVALFSSVAALWLESALVAGMQAVSVTVPEAGWTIDFATQLVTGKRVIGLADYMFDRRISRPVRAVSLFHLWLPPLLWWTVAKVGYDRRAFRAQTIATWALLVVTYRVTEPKDDINWVYGLSGSAQHRIDRRLYFLVVMLVYPAAFHYPAHALFRRLFPEPRDVNALGHASRPPSC